MSSLKSELPEVLDVLEEFAEVAPELVEKVRPLVDHYLDLVLNSDTFKNVIADRAKVDLAAAFIQAGMGPLNAADKAKECYNTLMQD